MSLIPRCSRHWTAGMAWLAIALLLTPPTIWPAYAEGSQATAKITLHLHLRNEVETRALKALKSVTPQATTGTAMPQAAATQGPCQPAMAGRAEWEELPRGGGEWQSVNDVIRRLCTNLPPSTISLHAVSAPGAFYILVIAPE